MDDLAELQHARALWQDNRLAEALAAFLHAAQTHPFHVRALADASRALGHFQRIAEAESLLDQLVEIGAGSGHALLLAGQSYRLLRRPQKALECLRAALRVNHALADAHLELAILLERNNALEEALEHTEIRLRRMPKDPEGSMLQGRLRRRLGQLDASQKSLVAVTEMPHAFWMTRARAHAELATLYDAEARYDEAWNAAMAGKSAAASASAPARHHRDRLVPALLRLAENLETSDLPEPLLQADESSRPLSLLTGLPRSGTTLLETMLAAHASVTACDEMTAFASLILPMFLGQTPVTKITPALLSELPAARREQLGQQYLRYLEQDAETVNAEQTILDKNPSFILLLPFYLTLLPSARLIMVLRDPRDVVVSTMMSFLPLNDYSVDFLDLKTGVSRIADELRCWMKLREVIPTAWREARYESLVSDPTGELNQLFASLGLSLDCPLSEPRGVERIYAPSYDQVARPIDASAVGRWKNYQRHLAPTLRELDLIARQCGYE